MTGMHNNDVPLEGLIALAPADLADPLQQLFTLIDAPASAQGFQRVARNLENLRLDIEEFVGSVAEDTGLWPSNLASSLQWLLSVAASECLAALGIDPSGGLGPPRGTLTAHPIYAALWLDLSTDQGCIREALVQIVVAHAMLPAPRLGTDLYHSAREKAGRAVRELAKLDPHMSSSWLPVQNVRSTTAYAAKLKSTIETVGSAAIGRHLGSIRHLIETATAQRNVRRRGTGNRHREIGQRMSPSEATVDDDSDDGSDPENHNIEDANNVEAHTADDVDAAEADVAAVPDTDLSVDLTERHSSEKVSRIETHQAEDVGATVTVVAALPANDVAADLEDSGSISSEIEPSSETFIVRFEDEPGAERSAMQNRLRVQAVGKGIARSNQKLVGQVTTLSTLEIDALIEQITRACSDRAATLLEVKSAVLVCCSLATGQSFADLAGLVDGVIDDENPVWLEKQGGQYFFRVSPLELQGAQELTRLGSEQAVGAGWQTWLPCPSLTQKLLAQVLRGSDGTSKFADAAALIAGANEFLARASKAQSARFTERRIQGWLFLQILNLHDGGIAAAALITATSDPLATNPAQYLTLSWTEVTDLYLRAVKPLNRGWRSVTTENVRVPSTPIPAIGSHYLPLQDELAAFIARMQHELESLKRANAGFVAIHNAMTLYTVKMSGFACGFRTVREPILRPSEIDETTGFAVLQDKDSQDGYNARFLWVPLTMRSQLKFYTAHLGHIRDAIRETDPARYQQMEPPPSGQTSISSGLFLLDENGVSYDATVPILKEACAEAGWHLPLNAGRHYLQSHLRIHCSNDTMLAFLGHWSRGTEPWSSDSGFDPEAYRADLGPALTKLLAADGWRAISGFKP
ncbi:hypothetical protein [Sandarakinorhabdus sp. DWP1-3-1]|uniref:hypothetical protein n=1 Tax=Sandarakinorhabdus sp. DWP1-3-1 TaxID=2804627 RepID=UPI003CEDEB7A